MSLPGPDAQLMGPKRDLFPVIIGAAMVDA
jgi:hypothetical protein